MSKTRRELIKNIVARKNEDRCGFWIGSPEKDALAIYLKESGCATFEELQQYLGDDIRWITPHYVKSTYNEPSGKSMRWWKDVNPMGMEGGPFAHVENVSQVSELHWPNVKYLNFAETLEKLAATGDYYRMSGFWSPFFHDLCYMLGTEELLVRMFTMPDVVHELLKRTCEFYLEANELFYAQAKGMIDAMFFGNDFGSQNDMLMGPEQFEEFFLPWIKKFADQAHAHGLQVVLHCCGSIWKIIPMLIEAGIDCIHPLQAQAAGMNAESLAEKFKGKIAFMGGIDTQHLLVEGSPDEVKAEVKRISAILAPNYVISPSHEALMPNVPFENVKAMASISGAQKN